MFNFIEKDMPLDERDTLNFMLWVVLIMSIAISITIGLTPFKPLVLVSAPINIIILYCAIRNNQIGLEQLRKQKRKR